MTDTKLSLFAPKEHHCPVLGVGWNKGELLSKMLVIVTTRFEGVFDKGGTPYVLHCLKVMHYLKSEDEELLCIGLGHDLIEDTFDSVFDGVSFLRVAGFTQRIIDGIVALTKVPGEPYAAYKAKVKANWDAVLTKKQDLRHNSDIRRIKGARPKDFERIERYHLFYLELKELQPPAN
jgi:(p)ppGpp synthase/HD superfamily hydrolase